MSRQMPNSVKYPFVLGLVCLICGGALAAVNFITEPYISANKVAAATGALSDILTADGLDAKATVTEVSWDEGVDHTYLNARYKVLASDSNNYFYYNATSAKGYAGTINFGALVSSSFTIVGYEAIDVSGEDTIGQKAAKAIIYNLTTPFAAGDTIASGASAKNTLPAIQKAFDAIIADAQTIK
jgi:Na+-translocating ferredoxin:NAD+ oxidoreductase RnfG subunit